MSNPGDYSKILLPIIETIEKLHSKKEKALEEHKQLDDNEVEVYEIIKGKNKSRLFFAGILCLMVLIFDVFVQNTTLDWLARMVSIPVLIFALIFSIIDGIIAIFASGLLEENEVDRELAKSKWLKVLWGLGIVKSILFIVMVKFVKTGDYAFSDIMIFMQLVFIVLIYIVLHFSGEGLFYVYENLRFFFLRKIWLEDPKALKVKIERKIATLNLKIKNYKIDKLETYKHFGIKDIAENYTGGKEA